MSLFQSKKSVGVSILLSIVTCGIYAWVWFYQLLTTLYSQNNQPNNAAMDIVLSFVTCGIYFIYMMYKIGKLESGMHHNLGLPPKDDSVLYLILSIFGLAIVVYAIVQSNINNIADQMMRNHGMHGGSGFNQGQGPGNFQ